MEAVAELESTVARIARDVGPAVVGVGQRSGVGSGVVVGQGEVLTNAHNVRSRDVAIAFEDGRKATGRVAGSDVDGDAAVVSVDTGGVVPIEWTPENSVGIGAPVLALANPGGRGLRVTFGLVSGTQRSFRGPRGRRISGSVEHTAPLLPGSSGGPIVDAGGRFLGLNTNRLGEGFYLAIPADAALRRRVEALSRGDAPGRRHLGVGIAPSHVAKGLRRAVGLPEVDGLLIRFVEEASPAEQAGLAEGDLIVRVAGHTVGDVDDLHAALDARERGGTLELTVLRGTEERTVSVTLG